MSCDIIKMYIFITPFKVMNYPLISKFLLNNKNILEKIDNPLFNIKMIKFSDHSFLIFQVSFILIYKSISLINYISNIVKDSDIGTDIHLS